MSAIDQRKEALYMFAACARATCLGQAIITRNGFPLRTDTWEVVLSESFASDRSTSSLHNIMPDLPCKRWLIRGEGGEFSLGPSL